MKILDKVSSWIDKLDAKIFGKEGYQRWRAKDSLWH